MKLTIMGSPGKGNPLSLVAVDNVIIKMATNGSRNVSHFGPEPEADVQGKVETNNFSLANLECLVYQDCKV